MFAQSEVLEDTMGIGVQDLGSSLARIDGEKYRDEAAYDMRVAVAGKTHPGSITGAVGLERCGQPDLAGATLNLVRI